MVPGEDCEYLRQAITEGKIGLPLSEGGADVSLKFLTNDCRRALVTVRGRSYAAVLVDLPCIIETMKSFEKKAWWKVADMTQMLLVLGRCSSEEEAKNYPLPREVDKKSFQFAHGLTPPLHYVRKRRFRKRLSYKTIVNVDEEVERLLKEDLQTLDEDGGKVEYKISTAQERALADAQDQYDDDDAMDTIEDGQDDFFDEDEDTADLMGNLQAALDDEEEFDTAEPAAPVDLVVESPAPLADQAASYAAVETALVAEPESTAATPAEVTTQTDDEGEEESDEDDDDDDDDADSPDVMDEDAAAKAAERNQQLEEVQDLEREIEGQKRKVDAISNMLLKQRAVNQLRLLEEDLRMKKQAFGLEDGDEEGDEQGAGGGNV
jgi:transcription initiation factor TFIID subunit 7